MSACLEVFPACAHCFLLSVNFSRLQFTLPLHIFLKEEVLPVEHYIGELPYPVAENHHPYLAREVEVELDMPVAVDEIVHVGVRLHVFLCIPHEIFLVLTHIRRLLSVGTLHAAVLHKYTHSKPRGQFAKKM